jgi:hypothetical protein
MRKKSAATVFGSLFGIFSLLFSFIVLFVLLAPNDSLKALGSYFSLAVCLFNPAADIIVSLNHASYFIGLGGFVLVIVALTAAGMRKHYIASGILLLISTIGVFILYYYPLLFGFNGGVIGSIIQDGFNFNGLSTDSIILMSVSLATLLFTLFGIVGAIISFFPKQVSFGQTYQQPYGAPNPPQYGQQPQSPQAPTGAEPPKA